MTTAQYPVLPVAAGTLARVLVALVSPVVVSTKAVARALRHRREANVLANLDRKMLADIGLTPSDVHDAFSAPLWQDPTTLLSERAIERRMNRAVSRVTQAKMQVKAIDDGFHQPATSRPARHAV